MNNLLCLNGYFWNLILQKCLLSSPLHFIWLLYISLSLICCQGDNMDKGKECLNIHLINHKVDKDVTVTFHTCL